MKTTKLLKTTLSRWAQRLWGVSVVALLLTSPSFAQSYCESDGGNGNIFNIDRVTFAGIDNTSGDNNGYADLTALNADVDAGASYAIALEPNGPFFLRYRWRVWVDLNQDGEFTSDERLVQQTGYGSETATISIPSGALAGNTRMRINMSAFAYQNACANWSVGEVEDYSITVSSPCLADAGTLSGGGNVCLGEESTLLTATPNGDSNTPVGYSLAYVLTSGTELGYPGYCRRTLLHRQWWRSLHHPHLCVP